MYRKAINSACKYLLATVLMSMLAVPLVHANANEASKSSIVGLADAGSNVVYLQIANKAVQLGGCATSSAADCRAGEVSASSATWLLLLSLIAFVGLSSKKKL